MKYKIDCFQSKESGFTQVDLSIGGEVYSGQSQCLPEDKYSRFTGGYIAELKAWIKYYKKQLSYYKEKYRIIQNLQINFNYKVSGLSATSKIFFNSELKEIYYHIKKFEQKIEILNKQLEMYYKDKND